MMTRNNTVFLLILAAAFAVAANAACSGSTPSARPDSVDMLDVPDSHVRLPDVLPDAELSADMQSGDDGVLRLDGLESEGIQPTDVPDAGGTDDVLPTDRSDQAVDWSDDLRADSDVVTETTAPPLPGYPATELSIRILGPSGRLHTAVQGAIAPLKGVLFGAAEELHWQSSNGQQGSFEPLAFWNAGGIPLQPGDNRISVAASNAEGQTASDSIVITYNPSFLFDGYPTAVPPALFAQSPTVVVVRIPISFYKNFDAQNVQLRRVDESGNLLESIGPMRDDGKTGVSGDEIQDDGIFTRRQSFTCEPGVPIRLRVATDVVAGFDHYTALSPVLTIDCVAHLTSEQCQSMVDTQIQAREQLDAGLAAGDPLAAVASVITQLENQTGVAEVGSSESGLGIWLAYDNGVLGAVLPTASVGLRGSPAPAAPVGDLATVLSELQNIVEVGSKRVLLLDPFRFEFQQEDEMATIATEITGSRCPTYLVDGPYQNDAATLAQFRRMRDYGMVALATHGDVLFGRLSAARKQAYGWRHAGSQEVLWTGEPVQCGRLTQSARTCSATSQCPVGTECLLTQAAGDSISGICYDATQIDLLRGRIVLGADRYGILPALLTHEAEISQFEAPMPKSLVYLGACRSLYNGSLASAFLANGAKAILGYSDAVSSHFANLTGSQFFRTLVTEQNVSGAAVPAVVVDPDHGGQFRLVGGNNLSVSNADLMNDSFENGDVSGWSRAGDGRVIAQLGDTAPVHGKFLGLISTGMGYTIDFGQLSQTFCIAPDKTRISFYWKYFSEEFLEYCGSGYQDPFEVTLTSEAGTLSLVRAQVDHLCPSGACSTCGAQYEGLEESALHFDQGPEGDVYNTQWRKVEADISVLAGQGPVELRMFATDEGDQIYDTVILFDHIQIK